MISLATTVNSFNNPITPFLNQPVLAYSRNGGFLVDGYVGPQAGFANGTSRMDTTRRAFSEMIERRAIMVNGLGRTVVPSWDILNDTHVNIPSEYASYRTLRPYVIDTSGTAVHHKSSVAIYSAIKELLEKNALFLLWYGSIGKRLSPSLFEDNPYSRMFFDSGWTIDLFLSEFFDPIKICIALAMKQGELVLCGLGSDISFDSAMRHAIEEAHQIGWGKKHLEFCDGRKQRGVRYSPEILDHIQSLRIRLPMVEQVEQQSCPDLTADVIKSSLPSWVKGLYVMVLRQCLKSELKCVKVFSYELINCLPNRENIDTDCAINRRILRLCSSDLAHYPECPVA